MSANPCPHGIPLAERKLNGCDECDAVLHMEFLAAQEAAKFRVKVIALARTLLPTVIAHAKDYDVEINDAAVPRTALDLAEAFERAADEYLKG